MKLGKDPGCHSRKVVMPRRALFVLYCFWFGKHLLKLNVKIYFQRDDKNLLILFDSKIARKIEKKVQVPADSIKGRNEAALKAENELMAIRAKIEGS